jgi:hypothetical protein
MTQFERTMTMESRTTDIGEANVVSTANRDGATFLLNQSKESNCMKMNGIVKIVALLVNIYSAVTVLRT